VPNNEALSDGEGKQILLDNSKWGARMSAWNSSGQHGYWLRGQPKDGSATTPRIHEPGAVHGTTQPDGMWLRFSPSLDQPGAPGFVDAIVVEVCKSLQNLNDKRSRYMSSTTSLLVNCRLAWLVEGIPVGLGTQPRWLASQTFLDATGSPSPPTHDLELPIRSIRILYALRNIDYPKWIGSHAPLGHEFFCRHSSLASPTSQKMRALFSRMRLDSHFYTQA
jgi:hypothetical protein